MTYDLIQSVVDPMIFENWLLENKKEVIDAINAKHIERAENVAEQMWSYALSCEDTMDEYCALKNMRGQELLDKASEWQVAQGQPSPFDELCVQVCFLRIFLHKVFEMGVL